MASGLTCDIENGQTFEEFVWRCARSMGAMIHMRDDGLDARIRMPVADSWHAKQLMEAKAELAKLKDMSEEQAEKMAAAEHARAMEGAQEIDESHEHKRKAYEAMLARVEAWEPPTKEHEGLKKLMREQIQESIRWDCGGSSWEPPEKKSGKEWLEERIQAVKREIAYHSKGLREDTTNAEMRRRWIETLDENVPIPPRLRPLKG